MIDRKIFVKRQQNRLRRANRELREIRRQAESLDDDRLPNLDHEIDELETRVRILSDQIADLKNDTSGVWKLVRDGFRRSVKGVFFSLNRLHRWISGSDQRS